MTTLLPDIDAFCKAHGMTERAFGLGAVNDHKFVEQVRNGRRLWPETEAKVRRFMVVYVAKDKAKAA